MNSFIIGLLICPLTNFLVNEMDNLNVICILFKVKIDVFFVKVFILSLLEDLCLVCSLFYPSITGKQRLKTVFKMVICWKRKTPDKQRLGTQILISQLT